MPSDFGPMSPLADRVDTVDNLAADESVLDARGSANTSQVSAVEIRANDDTLYFTTKASERLVGFCANGVTLIFKPAHVIDAADIGVAVLQSAIALCEIEPVLQLLESWLVSTIEWRPCDVPTAPMDFWIECIDDAAGMPGVGVVIDPDVHSELPGWPDSHCHLFAIRSRSCAATLEVDCFSIDSDDKSRIAPGAMLVLPASFLQPWLGAVRALLSGEEDLPVVIDSGHRDVQGRVVVQAGVTHERATQVRITQARITQAQVAASECVTGRTGIQANDRDPSLDRFKVQVQLLETLSVPRISAAAISVGAVGDRVEVPVALEGAAVLIAVSSAVKDCESTESPVASASPSGPEPVSKWSATLVRVGSGMGALLDRSSGIAEAQ